MENLDEVMEKFGLGLCRDGNVLLLDHQSGWESAFEFESKRLDTALHGVFHKTHHIGSTAISSICAKPILDILVEVPDVELLDARKGLLEKLGYEYKGEYGIPGRRYCVLYSQDKTKSYVHLHAFKNGDSEVGKHLLFRDYLRAFPNVAKEYEGLKKDLSARLTRTVYTEAKTEFIQNTLIAAFKRSLSGD